MILVSKTYGVKLLLFSMRIRQGGRFLSKQGHLEPHFNSKDRQLSQQLQHLPEIFDLLFFKSQDVFPAIKVLIHSMPGLIHFMNSGHGAVKISHHLCIFVLTIR